MFARIATVFTFLFFILPALASASAVLPRNNPPPSTTPASQCDVNGLSCCDSTQWRSDGGLTGLIPGILSLVLGPLDAFLGLTCTSATLVGLQGNSCSAQPVCCENNSFSGLVVIGCTPVNVNA